MLTNAEFTPSRRHLEISVYFDDEEMHQIVEGIFDHIAFDLTHIGRFWIGREASLNVSGGPSGHPEDFKALY